MDSIDPIKWIVSFRTDDRIYLADGGILLDQRVAFVDPLPQNGNETQYVGFNKYWSRPARTSFGFDALSVRQNGNYDGPDNLVLNQKYISFLSRRIPTELLRFGMTGGNDAPVRLYRGKEHIGVLMPIRVRPRFGPELIALAESGHAEAQMVLGCT